MQPPLRWIPIVLLAVACAPADDAAPVASTLFETRDSAGVVFATNSAAALDSVPLLVADTPDVRIGALDGAAHDQLYEVRGVRELPDGSILVLNGGTRELRRYDARGRWIGTTGGTGDGPGEMRYPMMMLPRGPDTTWIYDVDARRFSVAGPDGGIVRTVPVHGFLSLAALLDDSTAVVAYPWTPPMTARDEGWVTAQLILALRDLRSNRTDTLLNEPSSWREYRYVMGELVRSVRAPFTVFPQPQVHDGSILLLDSAASSMRVLDRTGRLERVVRIDVTPTPVTATMLAAHIDAMQAQDARGRGEGRLAAGEADRRRRILEELELPQALPLFSRLMSDGEHVWLRLTDDPAAPTQRWLAFDGNGRLRYTAELPAALSVRELTPDRVFGIVRDDDDVEYVLRYTLRATPRASSDLQSGA